MSALVISNVFVNGTTIQAAPFNQNFGQIVTWSTAIDNSNIGPAGLFANQLLPLTGTQATFGATATGVGYKFLANDATATPLTVSGVAGQSVDIFDVTLTSGGIKAVSVNLTGQLLTNAVTFPNTGTTQPPGTVAYTGLDTSLTSIISNVPTGSGNGFRWFSNNATVLGQLTGAGALNLFGNTLATSGGDLAIGRNATTAIMFWGQSGNYGNIDFGLSNTGGFTFRNAGNTGFAPVFGGTYTPSSDQRFKENVTTIKYGLETVKALQPRSFEWISDKKPDVGFIAQEVMLVVPEVVSTDNNGWHGVNYSGLVPVLAMAIQELAAAFDKYREDHP